MAKKRIIISILLFLILTSTVSFYYFPILLDINPFYTKESFKDKDGDISQKEYIKYSLIPTIKADLPNSWSIKSITYKENITVLDNSNEKILGDVSFEIYKDDKLVADLSAVTDTGGIGGIFYKFQDSDPEILAQMEELTSYPDSSISIVDVNEGEYTKLTLFGQEIRRVGNEYIPNVNEKEEYYFTTPLNPVLFYFGNEGPKYELYYSGKQSTDNTPKYSLTVDKGDISEEDLLILDSILESMEMR